MDIIYLDDGPVLHIVDEGTHFSAARFLPEVSTKAIWKTFLQRWVTVYTGLPHKILVDQGSSFGHLFGSIAAVQGCSKQGFAALGYRVRIVNRLRRGVPGW